MTAVMVALVLFLAVIKRKNRQERELQESLRCAMEKAQDASEEPMTAMPMDCFWW